MKPFDIEAAKRGDPVVTRDGSTIEFIAFDLVSDNLDTMVGIKVSANGGRCIASWKDDGKYSIGESDFDLYMGVKKVTGFVNVYKPNGPGSYIARTGDVRATEQEAIETRLPGCLATIPVSWEE